MYYRIARCSTASSKSARHTIGRKTTANLLTLGLVSDPDGVQHHTLARITTYQLISKLVPPTSSTSAASVAGSGRSATRNLARTARAGDHGAMRRARWGVIAETEVC